MFAKKSNKSGTSQTGKAKSGGGKVVTPLDTKQQALLETERRIQAEAEQLKRLIEEAPRLREERERRRREELLVGSQNLFSGASLGDRRYDVSVERELPSASRRLRSEQRDGKILFMFLLVFLVALGIWIAHLLATSLK
jgi:hypothetical protein